MAVFHPAGGRMDEILLPFKAVRSVFHVHSASIQNWVFASSAVFSEGRNMTASGKVWDGRPYAAAVYSLVL